MRVDDGRTEGTVGPWSSAGRLSFSTSPERDWSIRENCEYGCCSNTCDSLSKKRFSDCDTFVEGTFISGLRYLNVEPSVTAFDANIIASIPRRVFAFLPWRIRVPLENVFAPLYSIIFTSFTRA